MFFGNNITEEPLYIDSTLKNSLATNFDELQLLSWISWEFKSLDCNTIHS